MSSLVLSFQEKMADKGYNNCDLLRLALMIATKLKAEEIENWINFELYGYKDGDDVPFYRRVPMSVMFYNSVYGWCPIVITDEEHSKILSNMKLQISVSELESSIKNEKSAHFAVPPKIASCFSSQIPFDTEIHYVCDICYFEKVIDSIKTKLLEWILKLEENGVVDSDMNFGIDEIKKSKQINEQVINNFYGDKNTIKIEQDIENK
jgi:hypothetical protein